MKFKLMLDMTISVQPDSELEWHLPENTDQSVSFPCPRILITKMKNAIRKIKIPTIQGELNKESIAKLRSEVNPVIFDACKSVQRQYPEYYI